MMAGYLPCATRAAIFRLSIAETTSLIRGSRRLLSAMASAGPQPLLSQEILCHSQTSTLRPRRQETRLFSKARRFKPSRGVSKEEEESEEEAEEDLQDYSYQGQAQPSRNKGLAALIREGYTVLNKGATTVAAAPNTRKPLFADHNTRTTGAPAYTDRQRYTAHLLLDVATTSLEEVCRKDPSLTIQGEPIVVCHVEVKASLHRATVYWMLPYSILLMEQDGGGSSGNALTTAQLEALTQRMQEILITRGASLWQRRMSIRLKSGHPPKIDFKPAPATMREWFLQDILY